MNLYDRTRRAWFVIDGRRYEIACEAFAIPAPRVDTSSMGEPLGSDAGGGAQSWHGEFKWMESFDGNRLSLVDPITLELDDGRTASVRMTVGGFAGNDAWPAAPAD